MTECVMGTQVPPFLFLYSLGTPCHHTKSLDKSFESFVSREFQYHDQTKYISTLDQTNLLPSLFFQPIECNSLHPFFFMIHPSTQYFNSFSIFSIKSNWTEALLYLFDCALFSFSSVTLTFGLKRLQKCCCKFSNLKQSKVSVMLSYYKQCFVPTALFE